MSFAQVRQSEGAASPGLSPWTGKTAEPLIAVNVYAGDLLDEVIARVVEPCWTGLAAALPGRSSCYVWCLRSPRGGEHLKIRLHGPEELRSAASELIAQATQRLFSESPARTVAGTSPPRLQRLPVLDRADLVSAGHPDRSLIFTTPMRHAALFGAKQFGSKDDYIARFTACLGRGREVVAAMRTDRIPGREHARRLKMLRLLTLGLATLWPDIEERTAYVAYHRDWLVRFPILSSGTGKARAWRRLEQYESALAQRGEQFLSALGKLWNAGGAPDDSAVSVLWRENLLDFKRYLQESRLQPDPFARDATFPCVFKMLHALANQVGFNPAKEGLVYHTLLRAAGEPFALDSVRLVPS